MRKIILGLGSGRSGSGSLRRLLQLQGVDTTHEQHQSAGWGWDERRSLAEMFKILMREPLMVGDVGWYWLMHVPSIISFSPQVKFVCLQRDREKTLNSFRDHWWAERFLIHPDSKHYVKEQADTILPFPKYDLPPEEAEEKYYDFYYMNAESHAEHYPWNFGLFDLECLNSVEGQRQILDFLEIPRAKQILGVGLRDHASDILSINFNPLNVDAFKCEICGGIAIEQLNASMQDYEIFLCGDHRWHGIEKAVKDNGKNGFQIVRG